MKRFIRRRGTGAYLSANGEWVTNFRFARDFENLEAALWDVLDRRLEDTELVLMKGAEPAPICDPCLSIS